MAYFATADDSQARNAVTWACGTLKKKGYTFESCGKPGDYAWDILTPDGWIGVNSLRELCEVARTLPKTN